MRTLRSLFSGIVKVRLFKFLLLGTAACLVMGISLHVWLNGCSPLKRCHADYAPIVREDKFEMALPFPVYPNMPPCPYYNSDGYESMRIYEYWDGKISRNGEICHLDCISQRHAVTLPPNPACPRCSVYADYAFSLVSFDVFLFQHFLQDACFKLAYAITTGVFATYPTIAIIFQNQPDEIVITLIKLMFRNSLDVHHNITEDKLNFLVIKLGSLCFNTLVVSDTHPAWSVSFPPPSLGRITHVLFVPKDADPAQRNLMLVFNRHGQKVREWENVDDFFRLWRRTFESGDVGAGAKYSKAFLDHYGRLETQATWAGQLTLSATVTLLQRTRIFIGPHGGNTYNVIFAIPGTPMVEMVPTIKRSHTNSRFALAICTPYYPLPIPHYHHQTAEAFKMAPESVVAIVLIALSDTTDDGSL